MSEWRPSSARCGDLTMVSARDPREAELENKGGRESSLAVLSDQAMDHGSELRHRPPPIRALITHPRNDGCVGLAFGMLRPLASHCGGESPDVAVPSAGDMSFRGGWALSLLPERLVQASEPELDLQPPPQGSRHMAGSRSCT